MSYSMCVENCGYTTEGRFEMSTILDGKALAASIRRDIREEAAKLPRKPGIAVILVGEDPAS
jgi:hypothetical protein